MDDGVASAPTPESRDRRAFLTAGAGGGWRREPAADRVERARRAYLERTAGWALAAPGGGLAWRERARGRPGDTLRRRGHGLVAAGGPADARRSPRRPDLGRDGRTSPAGRHPGRSGPASINA